MTSIDQFLTRGQSAPRELIVVYGPPASGKSRFVTALTPRFGKTAYIAIDEGSENLDSVLPSHRERLEVMKPNFMKDPKANPVIESALGLAFIDWKAEGFDTLILDTFSNLVRKWLWYVTQKGEFQEKRNMIGNPGEPGSVALPDRSHYGGTQGIIRNFLANIFTHNPELNMIFVCHEYTSDVSGTMRGGPSTAGSAMLSEFPSNFKTVIRMDVEPGKQEIVGGKVIPGKDKYTAHMAPHGIWVARRNQAGGEPLTKVVLEEDPQNFWNEYDRTSPLLAG